MKLESIVLREIHMRLKSPFETSFGTVQQRRILLVEVIADGASGWGEVTAGATTPLKIKPGKDYEFVAAVRKAFPRIQLCVDANSAYTIEDAAHLKKFDEFELLMIEQPLNWDDIHAHSKLQSQMKTAICLDECIYNA